MKTLALPDLHAPYHHPGAAAFIRKLLRAHRPDVVVCLGDEIDAHCWSKWGTATGARGAADEIASARKALRKLFPADVAICNSNHVDRAAKRLEDCGVPGDFLRPIAEVLAAPPGWRWADQHVIDGVVYQHGDGYSGPRAHLAAALDNRAPTVIGHLHGNAGIEYVASRAGVLWGMACGCLIDPTHPVYGYGKHHRRKPLIGAGLVTKGVPQWIPLA